MTLAHRTLSWLALVALLATPLAGQRSQAPDPAKAASIRRLLDLTGAAQLSIRAMEVMIPAQRTANPQIPAAFWDAFLVRARRELPQLMDSLVPIYGAHFTKAQIDELVRFYESPAGRHLSEVQPLISQESIEVGQRWGAIIGRAVAESLGAPGRKQPN